MEPELLPDDDDQELLDKVDALLNRHQPKRNPPPPENSVATQPAPVATLEEPDFSDPAFGDLDLTAAVLYDPALDDVPVLTDIVPESETAEPAEFATAGAPMSEALLRDLETRLYLELEMRVAPQLSQAFGKALDDLMAQAKIQISEALREHLARELGEQHRS